LVDGIYVWVDQGTVSKVQLPAPIQQNSTPRVTHPIPTQPNPVCERDGNEGNIVIVPSRETDGGANYLLFTAVDCSANYATQDVKYGWMLATPDGQQSDLEAKDGNQKASIPNYTNDIATRRFLQSADFAGTNSFSFIDSGEIAQTTGLNSEDYLYFSDEVNGEDISTVSFPISYAATVHNVVDPICSIDSNDGSFLIRVQDDIANESLDFIAVDCITDDPTQDSGFDWYVTSQDGSQVDLSGLDGAQPGLKPQYVNDVATRVLAYTGTKDVFGKLLYKDIGPIATQSGFGENDSIYVTALIAGQSQISSSAQISGNQSEIAINSATQEDAAGTESEIQSGDSCEESQMGDDVQGLGVSSFIETTLTCTQVGNSYIWEDQFNS
jgi:hypothetical protein